MTFVRSSPATGASTSIANKSPCRKATRAATRGAKVRNVGSGVTSARAVAPAAKASRGRGANQPSASATGCSAACV
jgi:hypothetical protein